MNLESRAERVDRRKAIIFTGRLEQVKSGQITVEACVARHPRFSDLGDLLNLALGLSKIPTDPSEEPDPTWLETSRADLEAKFSKYHSEHPQEPKL